MSIYTSCKSYNDARRLIEIMFLESVPPGRLPQRVAIIAVDKEAEEVYLRFADNWEDAGQAENEELAVLAEDLAAQWNVLDPSTWLYYLQTALPNSLRLTASKFVMTNNIEAVLEQLAAVEETSLSGLTDTGSDKSYNDARRLIEIMFLESVLPGRLPQRVAIIALDKEAEDVHLRFAEDWEGAGEAEHEQLAVLAEDLAAQCNVFDPSTWLYYLQTALPNSLRLTASKFVTTSNIEAELQFADAPVATRPIENVALDRSRRLTLSPMFRRWLHTAVAPCNGRWLDQKDCASLVASTLATIVLIVTSWTISRSTGRHLSSLESSPHLIVSSVRALDDNVVTTTAAFVSAKPASRLHQDFRRKRHLHKPLRRYKLFQLPEPDVRTPEIALLVPDMEVHDRTQAQASDMVNVVKTLPPPPARDKSPRRVLKTLTRPFKRLGTFLSEGSRARVKEDTHPTTSLLPGIDLY